MDVPDEIVEAAVRYDFEHDSYLEVYRSYEEWKAKNPKAFGYRMDAMRPVIAAIWPALQRLAVQEAIKTGRVAPISGAV